VAKDRRAMPKTTSAEKLQEAILKYIGNPFSRAGRGEREDDEDGRRPLNTTVQSNSYEAMLRLAKDTGVPRSRLMDKILEEGIPRVRAALGLPK